MLTQMVRGAWLAHVRKLNGAVLGTTADLVVFANKVDDAPASVTLLDMFERERRDLRSPKTAAE